MELWMYNMKFGESIFIKDDYSNESKGILIDCGTMANETDSNKIFQTIYSEINALKPDALITHFHDDHLSGFIYFAERHMDFFRYLYIPDIFNTKSSPKIISLIILDYLLQNTKTSAKKNAMTLYNLVVFLCDSSANIRFLQRGSHFREFEVLAPFINDVEKEANELFDRIKPASIFLEIANMIQEIILNIATNKRDYNSNQLGELRKNIEQINNYLPNGLPESDMVALNKFGHSINIVFHNKTYTVNKNVLFTGDAETSQLNRIDNFYAKYKIYKIPHHGTDNHKYLNINAYKGLISNGNNRSISYNISLDYCKRYYKLVCTNCNSCNYYNKSSKKISCKKRGNELVFPKDKFTIKV